MKKRIISMLLVVVMVFSMLPAMSLTAFAAAAEITYIDENGAEQKTSDYNTPTSSLTGMSGVYYVSSTITFTNAISLSGDTTLILANGVSLTFNKGISGSSRNLRIYNVKDGTGTVTIKGSTGANGETGSNGTNSPLVASGNGTDGTPGSAALFVKSLAISNVTLNCTGGQGGTGGTGGAGANAGSFMAIDGGKGGTGGSGGDAIVVNNGITIYGGTLTATGGAGGQGGVGGTGGNGYAQWGYPGAAGGAGGNGGQGGVAIYLQSTSGTSINIKGNAVLNATGGNGGKGGKGGSAGSPVSGKTNKKSGNGGNGGNSGSNALLSGSSTNSITVSSGSVTMKAGAGGSYGDRGNAGSESLFGNNGSNGVSQYAMNTIANNFDSLPEHKCGDSSSAIGWNASTIFSCKYVYAANPPYTVTLNPNGGNDDGTASVNATYSSAMPAIEALPTRTGYTFAGFFDTNEATGGNQYYNADGSSTRNYDKTEALTLYARWTPNEYKITFDKNGGSGGSVEVTQTYDAAMASINMPTKPGYHSTGYYDSKGDGKQYYTGDGASVCNWDKTADTTLYAHWLANTYTTQYWSQDDRELAKTEAAYVSEESMTYGKFTLKSAAALGLTRTHYDFIGWNLYQDQDWAMYQAGKEYSGGLTTEENGTAVIYAAWKEKPQFTVTYDANGGAGLPENASVYRDDDYTISSTKPTRDGYTFTGWKSGSTEYAAGGEITNVQANITLTAQWQRNNSVGYHPNGGSYAVAPETKYPAKGETVAVDFTNTPTREGYTFKGYATSADAASATYTAGSSVTMGDSTVTLYAVWEPESYTITFTGCSGRYDFDGTKPTSVKRDEGYTFSLKINNTYNVDNLAVMANGLALTATNVAVTDNYKVYTYTVKKVTGDQSVEIKGIATTPYKISYVLNGGSIVGEYASFYENGISATLPASVQRSGYSFAGWFDNEDFTGSAVTAVSASSSGEKVFYAKWTANPYTVAYHANGGSNAPASVSTTYDTVVNLADKGSMEYGAYSFLGWDTDPNAIVPTYQAGDAVKNLTATANATVTLYAIWDEAHYSVTFHLGGGVMQNTFALIQSVKHGGTITTPAANALKKTGNEFMGWADSEGSAVVTYGHNVNVTVNGNMNLYAVWKAGNYTITYYNGDEAVGNPQDMTFGTAAALRNGSGLTAPDGKEFLGWSRSKSASSAEYVGGQQVTAIGDGSVKAISLYAVWGDKTAKYLTYNANGGTWIGSVPGSVVDYGDGSVTLSAYDSDRLTRPGYTRNGWLIGSKTYADGETIVISENTTVFANWVANTYTVKFNANGGSGAMTALSMTYDQEKTLTANDFSRTNYKFKGWARSATGPLEFVDKQTVLNLTNTSGEVNLYAVWEAIDPVWITYSANGGMKAPAAQSFVKDTTATVTSSKPTLAGYDFEKWNTKADGSGTDYAPGATFTISENTTLYAVWKAKTVYHVTYDLAGGAGLIVDPNSYYLGDTVTVRAVTPAKTGYTFTGWKLGETDCAAGTTFSVVDTMEAEIVLTAQWEAKIYKVSFEFGASEFTYDGNKKPVAVSAVDEDNRMFTDYTVKYKGTGTTTYEENTVAPTNVGTYTVTAVYDNTKYALATGASNTATLIISKSNVTVWATGGTTHLFGDADKSVSVMSAPNLALDVTYYSIGTGDKVASSAVSGVPSAVGKYLYVITLAENDTNKNYTIGDALSGTPTGKTLNALVGSNFGVMTIGNSAQKPLSFASEKVSKLTTDSAFTNSLTNPNTGATVTYTSGNLAVATVNSTSGEVTIVGAGSAVITAKSELDGYDDAYASYTLTVTKQEITVTVNSKSVTYGDAMPYSAITDVTFAPTITTTGLGTPAFTTTYKVGSGIGEYTVRASGLTSDTYSFVYEPGTLTVSPKTLNASDFTVTAAEKTYDGTTNAAVTATVKSTSLVSTDTLTVTATGSFADANVGTEKTVDFTIIGISGVKAANYVLGTKEGTTKADITTMPVTFSFGTSEFAYDGNKKTVAVSAVDKDNRVFTDYTVKYTGTNYDSATAPTNVGTYTVTAVYDTSKYQCASNTATLTITRGNAVVWASDGTAHLFSDVNKTITAMSTPSLNLTVTYYEVAEDGTIGGTVTPSATGKYLYVITLTENDEYNKNYTIGGALEGSPIGSNVNELTARNIGIMTIDNSVQPELGSEQRVINKTYGDAPFQVKVAGGEDGATITYTIPNEADRDIASVNAETGMITIMKPGSIVVKATASKPGFTDAVTYFTVIIEKRLVNIVLADEIVYAGKTITAPFTVTNDVEDNRIKAKDIQFFYQSRTDETNHDFRNVDAYFVTAEIPSSNEYYRSNGAVFHLINITKAPLTVTVDDKTITYGDAAPTYTVSYTTTAHTLDSNLLLGTDTAAVLSGTPTYTCTYAQYSDAGTYDISVAGLTSPNYEITFEKGTLTVNAKPVTLNWSNNSFTYDGKAHSVTATVANAVNGDTVNVTTYTDNAKTAAGEYTAAATALSNTNYTLIGGTDVSKAWSIARKAVTVKPANVSVYVNGTAELKLDVSALLAADRSYTGTPSFTLTDKDGQSITLTDAVKTAGTYTITWTNPGSITFNANYNVTKTETATLTVSQYSGGGGGGGGGGAAAPAITIPVSGNTNSVEVSAKISGSTAAVQEIGDAELKKVVGGETVEIDLTGLDKTIDTAQIPTATVGKIAEKSGMSVKLTTATVIFDKPATKEIFTQAKGDAVELVVKDVRATALNAAQKDAIESLNTVTIIDAYLSANGTKLCTEAKGGFGDGKAIVALPYTLKTGSNALQYSVYYVADDGTLEKLNAKYDPKLAAFVFEITHFSNYVVAYNENVSGYAACPQDATCVYAKFIDADTKEWYHDGVHFCVENGYMQGVSATAFNPSGTTTRAMIVTMLWRMEGEPVANYAMTFEDVKVDEWYTEAVRWAQSTGVVEGYSAEAFGPNDPITREQMATILYRYAKYHEIDVANGNTLAGFTDVNKVSVWALDAIKWANAVGLVQGRTTTTLVPEVSITRAEAATMVQRYCEKVCED